MPSRGVPLITLKAPTELNARYLYQLDAADNLPPSIIPLAVDQKIDHKYPKLLRIPLLTMEHNILQIPRKTTIGILQPIDVTDYKVNNISWTTDGTTTMNKPVELA